MTRLADELEATATREKLRVLETRYDALIHQPAFDLHVRELTLNSLNRMMEQLREELSEFEARIVNTVSG